MTGSIIQELKRRNVFRVAIVYIVVCWLLMQIGDVMFPALLLPEWAPTLLIAFLILGFPLVVVFAWAFELTPDGVTRTSEVPEDQSITADTGRKINYTIIAVLALAVVLLLVKDVVLPQDPVPQTIEVSDHSIAVLPFKNQSAGAENAEFFAGGLHDELLTLLSRLGELRVISRTSVERLDGELTIPQIGNLLGVATVLEGQVQRAGNRLRINVQLIDTEAEGHIWANTYDRELTAENVFDLQSDIARTIADALHAEISPAGEELLDAVPTRNTEALEQYLLGVQHWHRHSFGSLQSAIAYLTRATELDPQYAEAWVALASAYTSAYQTGAMTRNEYVRSTEKAVRKALDLNPRLGPAHAQQALLQWALGDLSGAEASFLQALELDPHDSTTIGEYAYFLRGELRPEEAIPLLEKQLVDDPLSTELLFQLGKAEMHAGRPERFVEIARRIREIDPSTVHGYTGAMQAYLWMGRLDLGVEWFARSLAIDPLDYENWAHAALTNEQLGAHEVADRYMRRAEEIGPGRPSVLKCKALIHLNRGENEAALNIARYALSNNLDDRWGSDLTFLRIVRDAALDTGDVQEVIGLYRDRAPGAFADKPEITFDIVGYAVDVILPLQYAGEDEIAQRIIDASMAWYERHNPARIYGYDTFIMDAELFALNGQEDLAIERLRNAVDSGWTMNWQAFALGRNLESLEQNPEYRNLIARLESRTNEYLDNWLSAPYVGETDLRDQSTK